MVAPDDGFVVKPDELIEMMSSVARAGSDLSNGLDKVRDGLMLPSTVGAGWEVDAPLARCANDWLQQMLALKAATSRASENLAKSAQSYMDTEGDVCVLPEEEQ
ncbi:hypothetical protein Rhe02_74940 [Rhizocola hellebori]|uniref:Excreted virulence factor EspC, type VII ESX diderm n=1 Tax=Rhizocola hellebori TaxID=1392758 RepID=A0A8J3QGY1_9ACTN|nr:hypothetical protein [Rhizocola hellebori]GIH09427.1 hypothetical protein Rhe02_74940 [Rhizocola hellebori]